MSNKSIDERIVGMQFDNKQFESGVKTSLHTLDKLKEGLNLDESARSLNNLGDAAKKFSLAGIADGVGSIASKFTGLGIIGVTALANIANQAVNAGKKIVSALTIDPIKAGFNEYETQINAVQTILANTSTKGTSLQQVNAALDELNTYADKTIYNFTEMTKNIGTFTAAGVDLKTSVAAIKGIANLAAVSGSNAQQASVAMYQLSQALSSGTVKLMDWNSVVNAGMGGQVFQDALKETARVHNVAIDQMIKDEGSFRETLQNGWLTSDILTETLSKFTGDLTEAQLIEKGYTESQVAEIMKLGTMANDAATKVKTFTQLFDTLKEAAQSGWSQSWKIIIGDFGEAKEFMTEMSNTLGAMIGASAEIRNNLLSGGLSSGWKQLLNSGISDEAGYIEALTAVAKDHGVEIDNLIKTEGSFTATLKSGWLTADMMSEALKNLTAKTQGLTDDQLVELGYTRQQIDALEKFNEEVQNGTVSLDDFAKKMTLASGRENLIEALRNSFEGLMGVLKPIKEAFREIFPPATGEQLYALTEKIRDFTAQFKLSAKTSENLKRTFKGLFAIFDIGIKTISTVLKVFGKLIGAFGPAGDGLLGFTAKIGDWLVSIDEFLDKSGFFTTAFTVLSDVISACATGVATGVSEIAKAFGKLLGIDTSSFSAFADEIKEKFKPLEGVSKFIAGIGTAIGGACKKIAEYLKPLGDAAKNAFANFNFAGLAGLFSTGVLGALVLGIKKFIDTGSGFLSSITGLLDGVKGCLEAYQNDLKANVLLKIAGAIGILALSFLVLSMVDSDKIAGSLTAITVLFGELMGSMTLFDKMGTSFKGTAKLTIMAGAMIAMSVAILILALALKTIASCDMGAIAAGTVAIGALTAILVVAAQSMSKNTAKLVRGSFGLILFATAILILSQAVKILGTMDPVALVTGLAAVALIMAGIAIFVQKMGDSGKLIATAFAIGVLAVALNIMAMTISILGNMPLDNLMQGLLGMGAALLMIVIAVNLLPKNMLGVAGMLLALAVALLAIGISLKMMGSMNPEQMGVALVTLGTSLFILIVAINAMQGALPGVGAMLAVGVALMMLAIAMKILGSMSIESVITSLVMLVSTLAILGMAAGLLTPVLPAMLLLGAALIVLAIGLAAIGAAALILSIGLGALAVSGLAGVGILLAIALAVTPLILLAPGILVIGAALLIFSIGVSALGVSFMLLGMGLGLIVATGPAGLEALTALAATAVQISTYALQMLAAGASMLVFGAGALVLGAGALVAAVGLAALGLGLMVLSKVDISKLEGLGSFATDLLVTSGKLLLASPGLLAGGAGLLAVGAGAKLTADGLSEMSGGVMVLSSAFKTLMDNIEGDTETVIASVGAMMDGIIAAINNKRSSIISAISTTTSTSTLFINGTQQSFINSGAYLVDGFIKGINSKVTQAANAAAAMARSALIAANNELGVESPSKEFMKTGMYSDMGLAKGLIKYADVAAKAATYVGEKTIAPVLNMTKGATAGGLATARELQTMTAGISGVTPIVRTEQSTTIHHTFDDVTVKGVNDKGELVAVADYAVEDMITTMMRRDSRR